MKRTEHCDGCGSDHQPPMCAEKPPLGLKPKRIYDRIRAVDILEAMSRYIYADKLIPKEWFYELMDLYMEKNKNCQK